MAQDFKPRLDILPPSQRRLWGELINVPKTFTLYGGTAIALQLGHRASVDFDFFSTVAFATGSPLWVPAISGGCGSAAEPAQYADLSCGSGRASASVFFRPAEPGPCGGATAHCAPLTMVLKSPIWSILRV